MFEKDEGIAEALERLKAAFSEPKRGTVIAWTDAERVMGRARYDRGGMTIVRRFRKWLLREHRIVTFPETSTGLRLLEHRQAAREVPLLRQHRAKRQIARGLHEIAAVDHATLSVKERAVLDVQARNMRAERLAATRSLRGLETFLRDRDTRPRLIPEPQVEPQPKPKYVPREGPPRLKPNI